MRKGYVIPFVDKYAFRKWKKKHYFFSIIHLQYTHGRKAYANMAAKITLPRKTDCSKIMQSFLIKNCIFVTISFSS